MPGVPKSPRVVASGEEEGALLQAHLAGLTKGRKSEKPLRCWVPACGTGGDAYGTAMWLADIEGGDVCQESIKVFATDANLDELAVAQTGRVPKGALQDVPKSTVHLVQDGQYMKVSRALRSLMVFAEHDLLCDPPISRLDLIRCNLFSQSLYGAKKECLIALFHYILNPGGYLWLDGFPSIDGLNASFETLDKRLPLLRRRDGERMLTREAFGFFSGALRRPEAGLPAKRDAYRQLECDIEELRTLNEELQTTIEDAATTNEELNVVNQELRARSAQLNLALKRLEVSETRYRSVVEDQSELICRYQPDGTIIFANKAFCAAMRMSKLQVLGKNFGDICPVDGGLSSRLTALTPEQPVRSHDYHMTNPGGYSCWQHWIDRGLFDDQGEVIEYQSVGEDITERIEAEQRYRYLAGHDQLTGLANRHGFFESVKKSLALAQRTFQHIAIHYLDLDRFKTINDALGHKVGDGLLQSVGRRLAETVRSHDIVARLGGDEFAVVQTSIRDIDDVDGLAIRILATVQAEHAVDDHRIRTSTTIGIAVFPDDGSDAEALLDKADLAMYESKKLGGNRYGFFTRGLNQQMAARYRLQTDLLSAIDARQFQVYFQPMVNLQSQHIEAVEALLRWQHPTRGLLAAAEFIDILEGSAEIVQVGEWVLDTACRQAKSWLDDAEHDFRLNVNLSATMLKQPDLVETVERILDRTGFDPASLELEITEHAVIDVGLEEAVARLDQLRNLGVRIALDDFGTGYSSLTFLRSLPVSHLKIDRSFVAGLHTSVEDKAIVNAVIDLGKNLSLGVTAEGVEDQDVLTYLKTKGCNEAQGYLFGAAMTTDEITDRIGNSA